MIHLWTLLLACAVCVGLTGAQADAPQAVWDTRAGKSVSENTLWQRLAQADVVFVGEQHDNASTHRFERQALQELHRRVGKRLILGMEMWERDVQPDLDAYLTSRTSEAAFLAKSRPWSNYQSDYRPLIEYAKANGIPVIASNVPQALASRVGREGLKALEDAPTGQAARLVQAPHDAYWQRFQTVMQSMSGGHGGTDMDTATIERFYQAQVLRDETMADSIAARLEASPADGSRPLVLHINGDFHSDYGQGIPARLIWRRPLSRSLIVSIIPVKHLPAFLPTEDRTRADFVIYVSAQVQ